MDWEFYDHEAKLCLDGTLQLLITKETAKISISSILRHTANFYFLCQEIEELLTNDESVDSLQLWKMLYLDWIKLPKDFNSFDYIKNGYAGSVKSTFKFLWLNYQIKQFIPDDKKCASAGIYYSLFFNKYDKKNIRKIRKLFSYKIKQKRNQILELFSKNPGATHIITTLNKNGHCDHKIENISKT